MLETKLGTAPESICCWIAEAMVVYLVSTKSLLRLPSSFSLAILYSGSVRCLRLGYLSCLGQGPGSPVLVGSAVGVLMQGSRSRA